MLSSAYSNLLNLHNISEHVATSMEERHARLDDIPRGPAKKQPTGAIKGMVANGMDPNAIYDALCNQHVDLVLTAHPTQALRQSLLKNFGKIRKNLINLQRFRLSRFERQEILESIRCCIHSAWRTDEIRRSPPTPQDEMRRGLTYFTNTIFAGVPQFMRRVDTSLLNHGLNRLPFGTLDYYIWLVDGWRPRWEPVRDGHVYERLRLPRQITSDDVIFQSY